MKFQSIVPVLGLLLLPQLGLGAMPTNPVTDPNFTVLPNGKSLKSIDSSLELKKGDGKTFTSALQAQYEKIKHDSQTIPNSPVTWVLMDLDSHKIIDQSIDANRKQFGASVNKAFIAGTLLDKQGGTLTASQLSLMASMLSVSSNEARDAIQYKEIGGGDEVHGRELIQAFTQRMGYVRTRAFGGYIGTMHGNELTALETAEYLYDTYHARFSGAEYVWKLMHTCRTGDGRGRTYLPTTLFVGGKTGTYDGSTVDPETGRDTTVTVRHHSIVFNYGGRQYALTMFANTGKDETTAILAGGIFREYIAH
ncbi:MAG: hypothetical protein ACXWQO_09055 [Bdellovibrionota bacterium]